MSNFKERLMDGLQDAVTAFNAGAGPTDAVIKAARAHNFNSDQAERLTETFNTARTINHFHKAASDNRDKSASFALADKDLVVLGLFGPKAEKRAFELYNYACYDSIPADQTLADIDISFTKKSNELDDMSLDTQAHRLNRVKNVYKSLMEDAQSKSAMATITAEDLLGKVASQLKVGYMVEGKDKVNRLFFAFDIPEYANTMDKLAVALPAYLKVDMSDRDGYGLIIEDRDIADLKATVKRAHNLLSEAGELIKQADGVAADIDELDNQMAQLFLPAKEGDEFDDFFIPGVKAVASPSNLPDGSDFTDDAITAFTGQYGSPPAAYDALQSQLGETFGGELTGILEGDDTDAYKGIANRMQNLQRTVVLEDLLINDPILSEADTDNVSNAYQALMQLSPSLSMNKEVTRAILRQAASENLAISPFDASNLLQMEKVIKEVTGTLPQKPTVK